MYRPSSTYRIQFHKGFTLAHLEAIIPYLQQLGIGAVYASPIFEAVPGSTHGYDCINPLRINPEIGTEEDLRRITAKLQESGIGWVQDIVPNHMAFDTRNPWLHDVLEKGTMSRYAAYFDISWNNSLHHNRLMVPFLGATLEEVITNGELKLALANDHLVLQYFDAAYPVHLKSYATILSITERKPKAVETFVTALTRLADITDKELYTTAWEELKQQWKTALKQKTVKAFVDNCIEQANGNAQTLTKISGEQTYRLCHWQETDSRINYRRFFTVNGLICLNIQTPEVLEAHHQYIKQLVKEGVFQGLRIDHIDGLYDPTGYLKALREMMGEQTYIVVEKILEPGEPLPQEWPIQGSSGYDYLAQVNGLLTQPQSEKAFTQFYEQLTHDQHPVQHHIHQKKAHILQEHMQGELTNLYLLFTESNLVEKRALASIHREDIKTALAELLIQFPVYRFYETQFPLSGDEEQRLRRVFDSIRKSGAVRQDALRILEDVLLHLPYQRDDEYCLRVAHFYQRCMQFTGPLMAKGVEDTVMYTYNRFIGHNEVGDAPEAFGVQPKLFHKMMQERQALWPLAMNGTSTHDTKRGEDVRARLNVLTEIPDEWTGAVRHWEETIKEDDEAQQVDVADRYFIYQTLIGAYPVGEQADDSLRSRIAEYLQKALREGKQHSGWASPDEAYEGAAIAFAHRFLTDKDALSESLLKLHGQITDAGIVNSLAQMVLKATCPGVPDVYQGCEFWDLSLVDPDNRRPADYDARMKALQSFEGSDAATLLPQLWKERTNAHVKLWLTKELLHLRQQLPKLFAEGEYLPLEIKGKYKNNVVAYARKHRQQLMVVALPLHVAGLCQEQEKDILALDWADTTIALPAGATPEWDALFIGEKIAGDSNLPVQALFTQLPLAILKGRMMDNSRGAGLLLHITSLPSQFGIGDMGPEAHRFADYLYHNFQKYWQLLPIGQTEAGQGHSPYSSISSRAINNLLISPELLVRDGWLSDEEIATAYLPPAQQVDYEAAAANKEALFAKAYERFTATADEAAQEAFAQFCAAEKSWLDDFTLFVALKKEQGGKAWFQWPDEFRSYNSGSRERATEKHKQEIDKAAWLQWQATRQWNALRQYCNKQGIQLIGDLPIYVSYDSVDVWSNREIFAVDEEGNMTGVAGTPPDAFSDDGQLWGMPVFRWDVLQERGYDWWIERLRHNTELFDIVRLDHFRAFADYWEVPANAPTAKEGSWKPGPGVPFFQAVEQALGGLPFVAEDLGEINKAVLDLRDQFRLPGMKILLFAFGEDMPQSDYIPHNYGPNFLVYTGTHDNNTVQGWYRHEADDAMRLRLESYVGRALSAAEVHLVLAQMAYSSVAKTVILPVQDLLGLDESARMNTPGLGSNNWGWRLLPDSLGEWTGDLLRRWTGVYNRR